MKVLNVLLILLVVVVGANSLVFFWRGMTSVVNDEGLLRLLWVFKMAASTGVIFILFYVFRIKAAVLAKDGDLAGSRIRIACGIGLLAAFFNSLAEAGIKTQMEFSGRLVGIGEAKKRLLAHALEGIFDQNILVYVLILALFLLTGFVQLASQLKSENESFI